MTMSLRLQDVDTCDPSDYPTFLNIRFLNPLESYCVPRVWHSGCYLQARGRADMLRTMIADTAFEQKWILQGRLCGQWVVDLKEKWENMKSTRKATGYNELTTRPFILRGIPVRRPHKYS